MPTVPHQKGSHAFKSMWYLHDSGCGFNRRIRNTYVTIAYARGSNPENPQDWIAFILTGLVIATVATALIGSLVTIRGKNNSAERR